MKYLFGPVNSRRLGISLGIDLVPHKTCSLNCIYCECGATTFLTAELKEYVPVSEVIRELDEFLSQDPDLDVLTFSGSGEPTLHSRIGEIIGYIKKHYPRYPVCVLTNGTLLWKEEVRLALLKADTVVPSLDAVSVKAFKKLNRPAPGLDPAHIVEGLVAFRKEFAGKINLEIFLVPGINDTPEELALIKEAALRIAPDLVQLNRLDRPGAEKGVETFPYEEFLRVTDFLQPLNVEIIGKPDTSRAANATVHEQLQMVRAVLKRRPSTVEDLSLMLGLRPTEVHKLLRHLETEGSLIQREMERGTFYQISDEE